jgi:hypothetical protein
LVLVVLCNQMDFLALQDSLVALLPLVDLLQRVVVDTAVQEIILVTVLLQMVVKVVQAVVVEPMLEVLQIMVVTKVGLAVAGEEAAVAEQVLLAQLVLLVVTVVLVLTYQIFLDRLQQLLAQAVVVVVLYKVE